ncbi:MAG: thioredoxin fold domain-containing protein [Gammaproteobacteria bacterium]
MALGQGRPAIADSAAEFIEFDDQPLEQDLVLPEWFKLSFLELKTDLEDAREAGKWGIILYFGRKDCPYCKVHLKKNWENPGVVAYTEEHFDVVAIDVRGDRQVIDYNGKVYSSEKEYAAKLRTNFTPSFLFVDVYGREVLRLTGYHPPYQFRAILEFVADKHYLYEPLKVFFARGETVTAFEESELNDHKIFSKPPYMLDRSKKAAKAPLAVFFEEPTCHSCNVLHAGPLKNKDIVAKFMRMDVVQLDRKSKTAVVTPSGDKMTAQQWADKLGLYYSPTIIFFDEQGKEILRIDSVIRFYRLNGVLEYILSKDYLEYETFQLWRQHNH